MLIILNYAYYHQNLIWSAEKLVECGLNVQPWNAQLTYYLDSEMSSYCTYTLQSGIYGSLL